MEEIRKGISSSTLKFIAMAAMLTDHIGAVILEPLLLSGALTDGWDTVFGMDQFMRLIVGRMAFPVYCFLLVQGFEKTSDKRRYLMRMLLFAFFSEVFFDLALSATLWDPGYQNVMFTLFAGLLVMCGSELAAKTGNRCIYVFLCALSTACGYVLAEILRTDYGGYGVLCIAVLYYFRKDRRMQLLAGSVAFVVGDLLLNNSMNELFAPLGFLAAAAYNGRKGRNLKYFFYLFYPLHLLALYWIGGLLIS